MSQAIAIVLTGAIIVSQGSTAVEDAAVRRRQYLAAVRYHAKFAPVYFLENSGYDLQADTDFTAVQNVHLRQVSAQDNERRGKGYREFHALDIWYDTEPNPPDRILKITGRYLLKNIVNILRECRSASADALLFDRYKHDRLALTRVFSASWAGYGKYLQGLYREVDDPSGIWIEHVVYRSLLARGATCWSFQHEPDAEGLDGSTGRAAGASRMKQFVRQSARTANRMFDREYLYFRGTSLEPAKMLLGKRTNR